MNIYEITGNLSQVLDLAKNEDVDAEYLKDTIESLELARDDKAEGYAKVIKELEARARVFKDEEDRLSKRRRVIENNIKRMIETLEWALGQWKVDKIEGQTFTVAMQNNRKSLLVEDDSKIPEKYMKIQTSIDRTALLKSLQEGEEIEGCKIQQTRSLRIR